MRAIMVACVPACDHTCVPSPRQTLYDMQRAIDRITDLATRALSAARQCRIDEVTNAHVVAEQTLRELAARTARAEVEVEEAGRAVLRTQVNQGERF